MSSGTDQKARQLYAFGPFRVDADKELLLREDESVPITPKAFQVLLVLIRHKKQVVSKEDLLKMVWPDTFVEEANLSRNIFLLRKALGESPQDRQYIVTVPGRGYRFAEDVQLASDGEVNLIAANHSTVAIEVKQTRPWLWITLSVFVAALAFAGLRFFIHRSPALTEKDTVVLGDFANSTGDAVFDGTLREGLAVELEQSTFLSLVSDQRIRQTLRLMDQSSDARLTPELAHDLCHRTQSAAYLTGSIASLGNQYVLGLKAVSCPTGDVLAEEQQTAASKEKVLAALDQAASRLREKLGESLKTVEKFDTPLEQATTSSLEALQAYTLGRKTQVGKNEFAASIPYFQRAIQIDPNFAMAYSALSSAYRTSGQSLLSVQSATKAYELRASVSEPEKFYIESTYYHYGLGDLEKAREVYELAAQTYPRYAGTPLRLWQLYAQEGQYESALPQIRRAIELDSSRGVNFENLVSTLRYLNRFGEAHTVAQQTIGNGLDSSGLRFELYQLAFLENDPSTMSLQVAAVAGKGNPEARMLDLEADTAAYYGRLKESRELSASAVGLASQLQEDEEVSTFAANSTLREALFGIKPRSFSQERTALRNSMGRAPLYSTALSSALAGNTDRAQGLADNLEKLLPKDTIVKFNLLPIVRAQIELNHHDPSKAIEILRLTVPYQYSAGGALAAIYLRGEAYLTAGKGAEAAAEFKKILDHQGIVANSPLGALAHLQLARAYALSGDTNRARAAYQKFLTLWKNADPDVPILVQAKGEYAKLK